MLFLSPLFVAALSVALAAALPAANFKVKERVTAPRGWTDVGRAPADHLLSLRIGLPQPNFSELERHLYEVSDPDHERYGDHLSKEEVEELVAPHPESLRLVNKWLTSHGISLDISRTPAQDWVMVTVPVNVAEKMLDTTYSVWKHESGDAVVRTTSYSLPEHMHDHVDVIQPTTMFGLSRPMKATYHWEDGSIVEVETSQVVQLDTGAVVDVACNSSITPTCLKQLYQIDYNGTSNNGNSVGITGYLEEYATYADLDGFYTRFRPDAVGTNFTFYSVSGGINNQSKPGGEANLDVQYTFGLAYPAKASFYSTGGRPPFIPDNRTTSNTNEPYAEWLDFVLAQDAETLPLVFSTSYGDDEQTVPESYAKRICAGMAQLGARGVSIFFSSGDYGVGDGSSDPANHKCFTNDGKNETKFIPVFPASCPYVTAVGGTRYIQPERAVSFSGGGFSNYFSRPAYQDKAISSFQKTLPKDLYNGLYNAEGRAFPDVSAQGVRFSINHRGAPSLISGTSASSPAVAGIFGLLNDVRIEAGLPPLGFVNPLLYKKGAGAFNDITLGNNPGCGTPGFNATKGYDPVTGLGTPNFPALKHLVVHQGKDYP